MMGTFSTGKQFDTNKQLAGPSESKKQFFSGKNSIGKECTDDTLEEWTGKLADCISENKADDSVVKVLKAAHKCFKKIKRPDCTFSSFNEMETALNFILQYMVDCINDEQCGKQLDLNNLRDCAASFFLYFINENNEHYNKRRLNKQLMKSKMCLQSVLENCPTKTVDNVMKLFSDILNTRLPDMDSDSFKYNLPEGVIWCTTLPEIQEVTVATSQVHQMKDLDATKEMKIKPTRGKSYKENLKQPTTRSHVVKPKPKAKDLMGEDVTTEENALRFSEREHKERVTPTKKFTENIVPTGKKIAVKRPLPVTEVKGFTPAVKKYKGHKTPHPGYTDFVPKQSPKDLMAEDHLPSTEVERYTQGPKLQKEHATPTPIQTEFQTHQPKSMMKLGKGALSTAVDKIAPKGKTRRREQVTPTGVRLDNVHMTTNMEIKKKGVHATETDHFPFRTKSVTEKFEKPIDFENDFVVTKKRLVRTKPPDKPEKKEFKLDKPSHRREHIKQTTAKEKKIPHPTKVVILEEKAPTEVKIIRKIPRTTKIILKKKAITKIVQPHVHKPKKYTEEILPTTAQTKIIPKPKEVPKEMEIEIPVTVVEVQTAKPKQRVENVPPATTERVTIPLVGCYLWSPWLPVEEPKSVEELLSDSQPCRLPLEIQCLTVDTAEEPSKAGQKVTCDLQKGFECRDEEQNNNDKCCFEYKVRFHCWNCEHHQKVHETTQVAVQTRPARHYTENIKPTTIQRVVVKPTHAPKKHTYHPTTKIMKILQPEVVKFTEFVTFTTLKIIHHFRPKERTQKFKNTEVVTEKFQFPHKIGKEVVTVPATEVQIYTRKQKCLHIQGPWVNSQNDTCEAGDHESVANLIQMSGEGCLYATAIECRTVDSQNHYKKTKDNIVCDLDNGLACKCEDAAKSRFECCCEDYEVRINCTDCAPSRFTAKYYQTFMFKKTGGVERKEKLPDVTVVAKHAPAKKKSYTDRMAATMYEHVHQTRLIKVPRVEVLTQTTMKVVNPQPKTKQYVEKEIVPTTKVEQFTIKPRPTYQETKKPTQIEHVTQKPLTRIVFDVLPIAITKLVPKYFVPKTRVEVVTPTFAETEVAPLTESIFQFVKSQYITDVDVIPAVRRTRIERQTPTTARYFTVPVRPQQPIEYTEIIRQTNRKEEIVQVGVKEHTKILTEATTEVEEFFVPEKPTRHEVVTPSTVKLHTVKFRPKEVTRVYKRPTTQKGRYTPIVKIQTEVIKPIPPKFEYFTVLRHHVRQTHPPFIPKSNVYTPHKRRTKIEVMTPPTFAKHIITHIPKEYSKVITPTEMKRITVIPPKIFKTAKEAPPVTEVVQYPKKDCTSSPWIKMQKEEYTMKDILAEVNDCTVPLSITCRTVGTQQDYRKTGQSVTCNVAEGFACRDQDQVCKGSKRNCKCKKYEVLLKCCNQPKYGPWLRVTEHSKSIQNIIAESGTCENPYSLECIVVLENAVSKGGQPTVTCDINKGYYCEDNGVEKCNFHDVRIKCCSCDYEEHIVPTFIKENTIVVGTTHVHEKVPVPVTRVGKRTHKPRFKIEIITPTLVEEETAPIPRVVHYRTKKPSVTKTHIFIPKAKTREEFVPFVPTKVIPYRPPGKHQRETYPPRTTVIAQVIPKKKMHTKVIPHVVTHFDRQTPKPKEHIERVQTPTYETHRPQHSTEQREKKVPIPVTSVVEYPAPEKGGVDCHFAYPQTTLVTECYEVTRQPEECSEERVHMWEAAIKQCSDEKMRTRGYDVNQYVDKNALKILKSVVRSCLRTVGDTSCRKESYLTWITQSGLKMKSKSQMTDQKAVKITEAMKNCMVMVDESTLESCYPGFFKVLTSIIVQEQPDVSMTLQDTSDTSCLKDAFCDCTDDELKQMQSLIENLFGACLPLAGEGSCDGRSARFALLGELNEDYCDEKSYENFSKHLENCWHESSPSGKFDESLEKKMDVLLTCVENGELDCVISRYDIFSDILSDILHILNEYSVRDDSIKDEMCLESMTLKNLKPCAQNLVFLTSSITEAGALTSSNVIQPVVQCFHSVLKKCSDEVKRVFLTLLQILTYAPSMTGEADSSGSFYRSIHSVHVKRDQVSICGRGYMNFDHNDDETQLADDMCVPILTGPPGSPTKNILLKSCRFEDIKEWMQSISNCMDPKAYHLGLYDSESLSLEKVIQLLQTCVKDLDHLQCRPKDQNEFRQLINSFLLTLKRFAMNSGESKCIERLKVDNTAQCLTNLHQYLVLKHEAYALQRQEYKSSACLKKSLSNCPSDFIDGMLDALRESVQLSTFQLKSSNTNYTTCDPSSGHFDDSWQVLCERKPAAFKKRHARREPTAVPNALNLYQEASNQMLQESESNDCSNDHYTSYFQNISNCQRIRTSMMIYPLMDKCNLEKYFEALSLCFLENQKHRLSCPVTGKSTVRGFLEKLGEKLYNDTRPEAGQCNNPICFGSNVPLLSRCTDDVFHLFTQQNNSVSNRDKILSKVLKCVKSVLPHCPDEVSFFSLPSISVPLGMDMKSFLHENEDRVCFLDNFISTEKIVRCSDKDKTHAVELLQECTQRTSQRLKEKLAETHTALSWDILPLSVCLTIHPVLQCRITDLEEYQSFMRTLLNGLQVKLREFLNLMEDAAAVEKGEKCVMQFSEPGIEPCLSTLFQYRNNSPDSSRYPSKCVEDIFSVCGNVETFHLLIKKSLNMSDEVKPEVCIDLQGNDFRMQYCSEESFDEYVANSRYCFQHLAIERNASNVQRALSVCQTCVQKDRVEMCSYELHILKAVVTKALVPLSKCLKKHAVDEFCIDDIRFKVKETCLSHFQSFLYSIMNNEVIRAAKKAELFYECIQRELTNCPSSSYKNIFNLFHKIAGVENLSKFSTDESIL